MPGICVIVRPFEYCCGAMNGPAINAPIWKNPSAVSCAAILIRRAAPGVAPAKCLINVRLDGIRYPVPIVVGSVFSNPSKKNTARFDVVVLLIYPAVFPFILRTIPPPMSNVYPLHSSTSTYCPLALARVDLTTFPIRSHVVPPILLLTLDNVVHDVDD